MGKCFGPLFLILSIFSLFSGEEQSEIMSWAPRARETLATLPESQTEPQTQPCYVPCVAQSLTSHVQIGGNYTYARVKPSGLSSTRGNLYGVQALYEYRTPGRIYAGLAAAWRDGKTKGSGTHRSIFEADVQERLGYSLCSLRSTWDLSFFTGFGYRHYGEKVKSTGSSITFNYNEFYVPVGFLFNRRVGSAFSFGLNGQWMPQVYPTVTIVPLKGARWFLTNEIANFRVELPLTAIFGCRRNFAVTLQPFFEYWKDGHTTAKSPLGIALAIPGNTYLFAGADLNLRYSF